MHLTRRLLIATAAASLFLAMAPKFPKQVLQRVPGWSTGTEPSHGAQHMALSAKGRWMVIESKSLNLLPEGGDFNNDIYLYDTAKDVTVQVSRTADGGDTTLGGTRAAISRSGRHVVYDSPDPEIVPPDTNVASDVFLVDVKKGLTERMSVTSEGLGVAGQSTLADVNRNGKLVVFQSSASQLVPGDTNNKKDIFLRDRKKGTTTRLSLASDGSQADEDCECPAISDSGRFVAFTTKAALVPEDTNGYEDVYVIDVKKQVIVRGSVATDGSQGDWTEGSLAPRSGPDISISSNGRFLAFHTDALNLAEGTVKPSIVLRDLKKQTTTLVSRHSDGTAGNSSSFHPAISPEGRFVSYQSYATNLVDGDTEGHVDIFVTDVKKGLTERVSVGPEGVAGNLNSAMSSLSARGKWVAFSSEASNLIEDDTNGSTDVFLLRR